MIALSIEIIVLIDALNELLKTLTPLILKFIEISLSGALVFLFSWCLEKRSRNNKLVNNHAILASELRKCYRKLFFSLELPEECHNSNFDIEKIEHIFFEINSLISLNETKELQDIIDDLTYLKGKKLSNYTKVVIDLNLKIEKFYKNFLSDTKIPINYRISEILKRELQSNE